MLEGFITIHRKILEWYGFQSGNRLKLWLAILVLANHKDKTILYNGEPKLVKRGSFVTSRRKLSELTKISDSYIENLLKELELQQQIQQASCTTSRLITILNYDPYQKVQPQVQPRRGQPADHGEDTTNNVNNVNNVTSNNIYICKKKFLDFVFLTDSEFVTLQGRLGVQILNNMMERLNDYIGQIGETKAKSKYKSHYHVILNWHRKDNPNPAIPNKRRKL